MTDGIQPVHPLGSRARVLLCERFSDPTHGMTSTGAGRSTRWNSTRTRLPVSGRFSLRMFHRSFGLMMIQENIDAPCTLLDFPTLEGFTEEISKNSYDVIGSAPSFPNIGKVRKMCELIRHHQPAATIVIGGHISNKERSR